MGIGYNLVLCVSIGTIASNIISIQIDIVQKQSFV